MEADSLLHKECSRECYTRRGMWQAEGVHERQGKKTKTASSHISLINCILYKIRDNSHFLSSDPIFFSVFSSEFSVQCFTHFG
ncbi:hypothetical protein RJT34_26012 [Clitoria ternatea]|uniref:Uncharacterized protein n=1 Tax=Clitoria ternatea TaxID=43366 RepID=A0AAN9I8W7_CLITE